MTAQKTIKQDSALSHAKDTSYYKMKMTKKDWIIVIVMMIVYSVVAFVKLGTFDTPQTYWTSSKTGEYIIVDLGEEYDISRINIYSGVKPNGKVTFYYYNKDIMDYSRAVSTDSIDVFKIYSYDISAKNPIKTRYLKIVTIKTGLSIGEIGIFVGDSKEPLRNVKITESTAVEAGGDVAALFDEPDCIPYSRDFMNSTYFDELYHGRTGYEYLEGIRPYEWTHPPLGKLLIAAGMAIFGKNMFGMRAMGTIFGVLMILLMYMFGKKVTKSSFGGFAAAFLMMFDFMHFTHSRISSIDVYAVTFVILMFYFMYDYYVSRPQNLGLKKSMWYLLFSGLFMGCAISVKWNTAYGVVGLALLFLITILGQYRDCCVLENNKLSDEYPWTKKFTSDYVVKIGILCVFAFIVLPISIYMATFIPNMTVTDGTAYTFKDILSLQESMYSYHSGLDATHSYQSAWYTWPVIGRPLYMYASSDNPEGIRGTIVTMGNPAVWWGGVVAVIMSIAIAFRKKDRRMVPVFIAIASLYLPWVFVSRCTFIYHYFPVLPFVILCSAYALNYVKNNIKHGKYFIIAYFAVTAILFVIFYPVLTGIPVENSYIMNFTRWFPSWSF